MGTPVPTRSLHVLLSLSFSLSTPPVHSRIVLSFISFQTDKFRFSLFLSFLLPNALTPPFQPYSIRLLVLLFLVFFLFLQSPLPFVDRFFSFAQPDAKVRTNDIMPFLLRVFFRLFPFIRIHALFRFVSAPCTFLFTLPFFFCTIGSCRFEQWRIRAQISRHNPRSLSFPRFVLSLATVIFYSFAHRFRFLSFVYSIASMIDVVCLLFPAFFSFHYSPSTLFPYFSLRLAPHRFPQSIRSHFSRTLPFSFVISSKVCKFCSHFSVFFSLPFGFFLLFVLPFSFLLSFSFCSSPIFSRRIPSAISRYSFGSSFLLCIIFYANPVAFS